MASNPLVVSEEISLYDGEVVASMVGARAESEEDAKPEIMSIHGSDSDVEIVGAPKDAAAPKSKPVATAAAGCQSLLGEKPVAAVEIPANVFMGTEKDLKEWIKYHCPEGKTNYHFTCPWCKAEPGNKGCTGWRFSECHETLA